MRKIALGIGCLIFLVSGAFAQNNPQLSVTTAYGPDSTIPLLIEFTEAQTQPTSISCSFRLATEPRPQQKEFYKNLNCRGPVETIGEKKYRASVVVPKGIASGKYDVTELTVQVGNATHLYNGLSLPAFGVTIENPEDLKFSPIKSIQ